jgi:hypothetical protein
LLLEASLAAAACPASLRQRLNHRHPGPEPCGLNTLQNPGQMRCSHH